MRKPKIASSRGGEFPPARQQLKKPIYRPSGEGVRKGDHRLTPKERGLQRREHSVEMCFHVKEKYPTRKRHGDPKWRVR